MKKYLPNPKWFIPAVTIFTLLFCLAFSTVKTENLNIRAIIGEASGEGYEGMLCVAAAIRNRGHLRGVYGVNAKHVDNEPPWVWRLAVIAWNESETNDPTDGADHWGSIIVDRDWIRKMEETMEFKVQCANQRFYKEK